MIGDNLTAPPLAPDLADLLRTAERDIIRAIVRDGDLIEGFHARLLTGAFEGRIREDVVWLLVPVGPDLFDALAAFEAGLEDDEDDDPGEEGADREPSLGATNGIDQSKSWRSNGALDDAEHEHDGREPDEDKEPDVDGEPSLGAINPDPLAFGDVSSERGLVRYGGKGPGVDQSNWARGSDQDLEDEHDGREPDADDEPLWTPVFLVD
jgi:hypothetical protein